MLTDAQTLVTVLFVIHTHLATDCEQTPYLSLSSPERECGKSRLLEVLELLVANPWMVVNPSEAVLFRKVDAQQPTLLWDEIDTVFAPATARFHEGHRALLDQGHRRYGRVPRFINNKVVEFDVFCPKVLCGIGTLPDTIASRSIPIRLQRRKPSEVICEFIRRDVEPEADPLRERIEEWADDHAERVAAARPDMPGQLSDRMKEGCEPLVAIADLFGEAVGRRARAALVEVLAVEDRVDSQETMRIRLLRDIRAVWNDLCESRGKSPRGIQTTTLIKELCKIEDAPWATYYGRGLTPKDLADLLRQFGIRPRNLHVKTSSGEQGRAKGYRCDDLADAWERYLDGNQGHRRSPASQE